MREFRLRIHPPEMDAEEFARRVFAVLNGKEQEPQYTHIQDIYDNDGRGNIRDFVFGQYSLAKRTLDVIYDRNSRHVVNFRMASRDCTIEQVPWHEDAPLQFIGENSTQFRLRCEEALARRIVAFFVEIEQQGLEGYRTETERRLEPRRIEYVLTSADPFLVLHRFNKTEYGSGIDRALLDLEEDLLRFPEYAPSCLRIVATILQYRKHPRCQEFMQRASTA